MLAHQVGLAGWALCSPGRPYKRTSPVDKGRCVRVLVLFQQANLRRVLEVGIDIIVSLSRLVVLLSAFRRRDSDLV